MPKLAIVTGSASGLGKAFCRQLASQGGWRLIVADIEMEGAREAAAELESHAGALGALDVRAEGYPLDVTDRRQWDELCRYARLEGGSLNLLVNNAGVCAAAELAEGTDAEWQRVFEVNFWGTLWGCRSLAPWLLESVPSGARLINIASIAGILAPPAMGAYGASKAAVIALTEALYAELRPRGVEVSVVAPGFFRSGLLQRGTFARPLQRRQAERLVRSSTIDADEVARIALAQRHRLYIVLGRRARWLQRWKRLAPQSFHRSLAARYEKICRADPPEMC